jgi:hypothetical protein
VWRVKDNTWINFGDDEFRISDKGDRNRCISCPNYHYFNKNYNISTINKLKASWKKFTGNNNPYFYTK